MKFNYLFPYKYKKPGWALFILGFLLGLLSISYLRENSLFNCKVFAFFGEELFGGKYFFSIITNNILDELACIFLIFGAFFIAFSKENSEDEFISKIRLESLVWSTYMSYGVLLLAVIFVYGIPFFWVLAFNMFTLLTFFIVRFKWAVVKFKKQIDSKELL
ncbi:MAG: hypothetical protein VXX63_03340 [Bacteroidota bacterium]|nr:hypothetical protein [Bacteroidota bacterium]